MKSFFSSLAVAALATTSLTQAQITALDSGFAPAIDGSVNVISSASAPGSYYIAGDFTQVSGTARTRIARIAADGSLDTAFDPGTSANGAIYTLLTESGGGVLAGGGFTLVNGTARPALCRLSATGAVDPAVSTTATVITAMAVNGSYLYAAGNFPRSDAPGQYSFRIVRMAYPTGFTGNNYDPSYAEPTITGTVNALFFQLDGKLVIGGDFTAVNGTARTNLARLTTTGSLDSTFTLSAVGGAVRTLVDYAPGAGALVVGGDFTALGGSSTYAYYGVVTLSGGTPTSPLKPVCNGPVRSIVSLGSGDMILAGDFTTIGGQSRTRVARVNALSGRVEPALDISPNASVRVLLKDSTAQNHLVLGGSFTQIGSVARTRLARLLPFGAIDTAWPEATGGDVRTVAIQPGDATLVGGSFTALGGAARSGLGRVLATGALDTAYAPALDGPVNAIAALPDGRALIGGSFTTAGGGAHANLALLNADGTVDAAFVTSTDGEVSAIAQQADGKVYVAGSFTTIGGVARNGLARLNTDGTVDTSFDAALDGAALAVIVQTDGKVLIGGDFLNVGSTAHARLARVDATGALDATFTATAGGSVRTLNLDATDNVLVGGSFSSGSSFSSAWSVWLTSTGITAPGGVVFYNGAVQTSMIDSSGTAYLGGEFTSANDSTSTTTGPIAHLDGNKVSPTLPMTGVGTRVRSIAARSDGALVVGGTFGSMGDTTRSNLGLWVNAEGAGSVLTVNGTGTSVSWTRNGSLPSPTVVAFDLSTDNGVTWTSLGVAGAPTISGISWVNTLAISTPVGVPYLVRGRGLASDGVSSSWVQAVSTPQLRQLPVITTQPQDQTVNPGTYVTFSVTATSASGMSYQWRKNGISITGATNTSYSFISSNTASADNYSVVITNSNGPTTSRDATLTVRASVAITTQPVSVTVPAGTTGTLSVTATGDSPAYQWQEYRYSYTYPYGYQWFNLPGATSSTYERTTSTPYMVRVVVSNAFSSVASNSASIIIVQPPTISWQPVNTSVNVSGYLSLSVGTSSSVTYQWFKNDVPIDGAITNRLEKYVSATDAGIYKVVLTNVAGSVTSNSVTVRVMDNTAPVIVQQPQPVMIALGNSATLDVDVTGQLSFSYEWRRNGALLYWGYERVLNVGSSMSDSGLYNCRISNLLGSVFSKYASVIVVDTSPSSLVQPQHGTATLQAPTTALGVTYRWRKDGEDLAVSKRITSVTSQSLVIKDLTPSDAGDYTCVIGSGLGTMTGGTVALTVQDKVPTISATTLTDARVAQAYDAQLTATELPTKFTVSGLPHGLSCDTTGHITGTPTELGAFKVKVIAANGVGSSPAITLNLKVLGLPDGISGSWLGISSDNRVDARITSTGIVTGTIHMGIIVARFRTTLVVDPDLNVSISSFQHKHPFYGLVTWSGSFNLVGQNNLEMSASYDVPPFGPTTSSVSLWHRVAEAEVAPFKGYHTASLNNDNPSGYSTPEGSGYAAINVSSTGSTTISGRLADGTAHSTSGFIGSQGEVAFYCNTIRDKAMVSGRLAIVPGTAPDYYGNTINGTLDWFRAPIPGRLYPDGFYFQLSVRGSKYLKPNLGLLTGPIVMNLLDAPANVALSFNLSGEGTFGSSFGRISTTNHFRLQSGGSFISAAVTVNAATGTFSAVSSYYSNSYYAPILVRRSGTAHGIIVSNPSTLRGTGAGYIILPLLPVNVGETLSNTPQVSASVGLVPQ